MAVTIDPDGLRAGGTAFNRNAEELLGHARTVAELAALRAAFAGAGESVWPIIETRLSELAAQLEEAHRRASNAGTVLTTAADSSVEIDNRNANTMRK